MSPARSSGCCAPPTTPRRIPARCPLDIYRSINPFSEAHFKTLKYRPGFPDRFGSIEDARAFCRTFFGWYNEEHRHGGIGLLTPGMVHRGEGAQVRAARQAVLADAYAAHPERFARKHPEPPKLPTAVWINPPKESPSSQ